MAEVDVIGTFYGTKILAIGELMLDHLLQRRYISLFKPHHFCYGTPTRIGLYFLHENIELLDLEQIEKEKSDVNKSKN